MSPDSGMLRADELASLVERGEIDTVLTVFPDLYGRLLGKRVTGRFFLKQVESGGMHVCDYLLACDMEMDPIPGYRFASWETGYGDMQCVPDATTLRRAAWLERTALVLCDLRTEPEGNPIEVSPRRMLQRQVERARKAGYRVMGGSEIEFYLFDESYESARSKQFHSLKTASSYIEDYHIMQGSREDATVGAIRRALDASGVPVESTKGEWGPGQQELNLEYSEALLQADRNVIYKHAAKEIADQHGKALTFMSKWDEKLAGSSMHVHISLWNEADGRSAFAGEAPVGPVNASETFRWFLGGMIAHTRELTACFAPLVTSYKRFQAGSFAPTSVAWSHDNRTAGFRVVGQGDSLRIECRIPGADANPYIVYAAIVAAGLDGIEQRTEPPAVFAGDIYQARDLPRVPSTLPEAISEFEQSEFARTAFGAEVAGHFLHFLKTEQRKFDEVVTCWERSRYFERI